MKKTKMEVADTLSAAAGLLNVPLSAVRKAKRDGCTAFKNGRVHLPTLRRWLTEHTPHPTKAVRTSGKTGLPFALTRLAAEELRLHAQMQANPGDEMAHKNWCMAIDTLRKMTTAAGSDGGGEWVERNEVANSLAVFLGFAKGFVTSELRAVCPRLAGLPDTASVVKTLDPLVDKIFRQAIASAASCTEQTQTGFAPWLVKATEPK